MINLSGSGRGEQTIAHLTQKALANGSEHLKSRQNKPNLNSLGGSTKWFPVPRLRTKSIAAAENLKGNAAPITGGDSGIGRAVTVAFAKEGADVSVVYFNEHEDAKETQRLVENHGVKCILIAGDAFSGTGGE